MNRLYSACFNVLGATGAIGRTGDTGDTGPSGIEVDTGPDSDCEGPRG